MTFERLSHVPFGARVEERKEITPMQISIPRNPHLHPVHIVLERWSTRVVDEEEVRIEIDMRAVGGFDRGPVPIFDKEMVLDGAEQRTSRKGHQ